MREMQVRKRQGDEWEEFPLIDVHASIELHKTLSPFPLHQTLSQIELVTPSHKFEWATSAPRAIQRPRTTAAGGYLVELPRSRPILNKSPMMQALQYPTALALMERTTHWILRNERTCDRCRSTKSV